MIKAKNVFSNEIVNVEEAKFYTKQISDRARYQFQYEGIDNLVLLLSTDWRESEIDKIGEGLETYYYIISGMLYNVLYTNALSYFEENYPIIMIENEQLTLF